MSSHYLIHLPHSGTDIPKNYIKDYLLSESELNDNIFQYADLYTDELFDKMFHNFGGVKSEFSRLFFDPERFYDDEMESMQTKFGLGWFYENAILEKKPLRGIGHKTEISKYYENHHKELNAKTKEKLEKHGKCSLIDCHSFSNEIYWFLNNDLELPDICIGYEEYHKDEFLVELILEEFKEYKIGINKPYMGSLVPMHYYQKKHKCKICNDRDK